MLPHEFNKIREIYENSLALPISERTAYIDGAMRRRDSRRGEATVESA